MNQLVVFIILRNRSRAQIHIIIRYKDSVHTIYRAEMSLSVGSETLLLSLNILIYKHIYTCIHTYLQKYINRLLVFAISTIETACHLA